MEPSLVYPTNRLRPRCRNKHADSGRVSIPATYRPEWPDGFGARGWKLDAAITNRQVIASTSYTGEKVPTSVLVHDILDHYVSGFGFSGHRNEAMAVAQLGLRTGTEIRSSYVLMIEEVLRGEVEGEGLDSFLPPSLKNHLPPPELAPQERMRHVTEKLGVNDLRSMLLAHFYEMGLAGVPRAIASWGRHGLDYDRRAAIGLCLQRLLVRADAFLEGYNGPVLHGAFVLSNNLCALSLEQAESSVLTDAVE